MGIFNQIHGMLNDGATIQQLQKFIMGINNSLDQWQALELAQKYYKQFHDPQ
jgi:hypothetical protein